jgi:hypothetical protein
MDLPQPRHGVLDLLECQDVELGDVVAIEQLPLHDANLVGARAQAGAFAVALLRCGGAVPPLPPAMPFFARRASMTFWKFSAAISSKRSQRR